MSALWKSVIHLFENSMLQPEIWRKVGGKVGLSKKQRQNLVEVVQGTGTISTSTGLWQDLNRLSKTHTRTVDRILTALLLLIVGFFWKWHQAYKQYVVHWNEMDQLLKDYHAQLPQLPINSLLTLNSAIKLLQATQQHVVSLQRVDTPIDTSIAVSYLSQLERLIHLLSAEQTLSYIITHGAQNPASGGLLVKPRQEQLTLTMQETEKQLKEQESSLRVLNDHEEKIESNNTMIAENEKIDSKERKRLKQDLIAKNEKVQNEKSDVLQKIQHLKLVIQILQNHMDDINTWFPDQSQTSNHQSIPETNSAELIQTIRQENEHLQARVQKQIKKVSWSRSLRFLLRQLKSKSKK